MIKVICTYCYGSQSSIVDIPGPGIGWKCIEAKIERDPFQENYRVISVWAPEMTLSMSGITQPA